MKAPLIRASAERFIKQSNILFSNLSFNDKVSIPTNAINEIIEVEIIIYDKFVIILLYFNSFTYTAFNYFIWICLINFFFIFSTMCRAN